MKKKRKHIDRAGALQPTLAIVRKKSLLDYEDDWIKKRFSWAKGVPASEGLMQQVDRERECFQRIAAFLENEMSA